MTAQNETGRERGPTDYFRSFCDELDPACFEAMVELSTPRLRRAACTWITDATTIDEAIQSTWVTAYLKRGEFDNDRRLAPWLIGILRRCLLGSRRRRSHSPSALESAACEEAATDAPPDRALLAEEARRRVLWAVETQSPTYREILRLHLIDELGPTAIAHQLARNPSTVRNQLSRGLNQLRRSLEAH